MTSVRRPLWPPLASRRQPFGAGRNGLPRRVSRACCATRPDRRARRRSLPAGPPRWSGGRRRRHRTRRPTGRHGRWRSRGARCRDGAAHLGRERAQPHRWRVFKLSKDPAFVEKLHDIVGLYVAPPAHAVVLSFDEKSQIQALDRSQPGLPLKKGRGATMTHDYKRHGTTTLFAALNVLTGEVFGRNMQRPGIRSSSASSTPLSETFRQARSSTSFSTTTPPTSTRESAPGSCVTRAGPSTSRRHRVHG